MSILSQSLTYNERSNQRLFELLSLFINFASNYITREMVDSITGGDPSGEVFAYANIAASACGLDVYKNPDDKHFFRTHFLPCFKKLDLTSFIEDPYYNRIVFPNESNANWTFKTKICQPYEAFVFDDPKILPDGRVLPCIGFFDSEYKCPIVLENGREWMTLMPNEINTIKRAVDSVHGRVLTFGLGLGYFTFMASFNQNVESVTVVERSKDVIKLFNKYIYPQFLDGSKVTIIESDAFDFAESRMAQGMYDSVFVDIWRDPSDGCDLYLRMKKYEHLLPYADFIYWIEDTLKLYI